MNPNGGTEPAIGVDTVQRNASMPIAVGDLGCAGDAASTEERDLAEADNRVDTAQSFLSAMKGLGENEDEAFDLDEAFDFGEDEDEAFDLDEAEEHDA